MWEHIKTYREFYLGASWFAIFLLLFAIFAIAGFPGGAYDDCFKRGNPNDVCWCEGLSKGNIKEPSNTWSNLGFVIAGLMILWQVGRDRATGVERRNRFVSAENTLYPVVYGNLVLYMGPASMLYHASLTVWGDVADQLSMFMFVAFFCSYSAVQLWSACRKELAGEGNVIVTIGSGILFLVYTILQMAVTRGGHHPSSLAIGLFIGLAMALQVAFIVVTCASRKGFAYQIWGVLFFAGGLGAFLLANLVHNNEAPGESNCLASNAVFYPQSWLQAHALWQILAAVMTYCLYWFFRFEKSST
jgi:Ceramidase